MGGLAGAPGPYPPGRMQRLRAGKTEIGKGGAGPSFIAEARACSLPEGVKAPLGGESRLDLTRGASWRGRP
jgi:hypothetical protein